jgi:hypothetical protein
VSTLHLLAIRRRYSFLPAVITLGLVLLVPSSFAAVDDKSPSPPVGLEGHLSAATAAIGEQLRFWITVTNRSNSTIDEVRLEHLDTPGFVLDSRCWVTGADNKCGVPADASDLAPSGDVSLLARHLAPYESRTVWGVLVARNRNGPADFVAVIGWKSSDERPSSSHVVLGTGASQTPCAKRWATLKDVIKDLWIPFLAVLIPVAFAWNQHRRDLRFNEAENERQQSAQKAENERARVALEAENERARVAREAEIKSAQIAHDGEVKREQLVETWNLMLLRSDKVVRRYYMPILGALDRLMYYAGEFLKNPPDSELATNNLRLAFYYTMRFAWHSREQTDKAGGYFFKDRVGEQLASNAFLKYWVSYGVDRGIVENRTRLLDLMTGTMSNAEFTAVWAGDSTLFDADVVKRYLATKIWEAAFKRFEAWMKSSDAKTGYPNGAALYLQTFYVVLLYESNRPYTLWYGKDRPADLSAVESTIRSLTDNLQSGEIEAWISEAKKPSA